MVVDGSILLAKNSSTDDGLKSEFFGNQQHNPTAALYLFYILLPSPANRDLLLPDKDIESWGED